MEHLTDNIRDDEQSRQHPLDEPTIRHPWQALQARKGVE
jgi:hypothetical protein